MTPPPAPPLRVLAFAGSLRARSTNRALLKASRELAPEGMEIIPYDLGDLPLYNADLDRDGLRPEVVEAFKAAITEADALLIATPEHNHSLPGVLTTALDWASRPARRSPLAGKPVGMVGAASGVIGTARAQEHLKLVLDATLSLVLPHPGVLVGRAAEKFDAEGRLVDGPTRQFLTAYLEDLAAWTHRVSGEGEGAQAYERLSA